MPIVAYLHFQGNAREAIDFYADTFGVEIPRIVTYGDMPSPDVPVPDEMKNLVMNATMIVNGGPLLVSDVFPGIPFTVGDNINLLLHSTDRDELTNWFNKLKEGGSVTMPLQEMPWSKWYGQLTDKYGIQWQANLDDDAPGR